MGIITGAPVRTGIGIQNESSYGIRAQRKLGPFDFPFTLNPTQGCFFVCKYCYSPDVVYRDDDANAKRKFFENVVVKLDKPDHVRRELARYTILPQHLKRVQVNETSEYYLPQVMATLKDEGKPDPMLGILEAFREAWQSGNRWMCHILTKSHLILKHLDVLASMKHMVQVEVSFATGDESVRRKLEYFSTSIKKRLELVEQLSAAGLFVRVMAMPFYGMTDDLKRLQDETFRCGAKAFKNKGLNYYEDWNELVQEQPYDEFMDAKFKKGKGRIDEKEESLIIKSGEAVRVNGVLQTKCVQMPVMDAKYTARGDWSVVSKMQERFSERVMPVIDCGYRECNDSDWGCII